MKTLLSLVTTLIVFAALLGLSAAALAYRGAINVAATEDHLPGVRWFLETLRTNSIHARAHGIHAPQLTDAMAKRGAAPYNEKCAICHGAPGAEPSEIGKGLNPSAPELWKENRHDASVNHWIVKHGIRMTGMPAFGPTHSDEDLWDIVAFVKKLPRMKPEEYSRLTEGKADSRQAGTASLHPVH